MVQPCIRHMLWTAVAHLARSCLYVFLGNASRPLRPCNFIAQYFPQLGTLRQQLGVMIDTGVTIFSTRPVFAQRNFDVWKSSPSSKLSCGIRQPLQQYVTNHARRESPVDSR